MLLVVRRARKEVAARRFIGVRLTRQSTPHLRVPAQGAIATASAEHRLAANTYTPTARAARISSTRPSCSGYIAGRLGAIVRRRSRRHMGHTVGMAEAFPIVIIGVSVAAIVIAVVASLASGGPLRADRPRRPLDGRPRAAAARRRRAAPAARAEADEEIRQLVEAKSARRVARGQAPLDVDAEIAALTQTARPAADQGLRDEVRQLVVARNERRCARARSRSTSRPRWIASSRICA